MHGIRSKLQNPGTLRAIRIIALLACLVAIGLPQAQGSYAQTAPSQLVVDSETIDPQFPDTVDFTLQAHGFEAQHAVFDYRLVGDPVTTDSVAQLDGPTSNLDLKVSLDLSTHYIPPGTEVIYYWELTDNSGSVIHTPEKTFTMQDATHNWQDLADTKQRVSVHWYDGDQQFGQSLLTTASSALERLQHDIGAGLEHPASIWVYSSQDDLISALPKNEPEWIGGKAFPELAVVMADISPGYGDDEIKRIVPHELSHLVLYQATRNPYNEPPAWLDEGLAVHNQEAQDPSEEDALRSAALEGKLVPLKSLSGSFGADEEAALLSYAESRSAIDFVLKDSRYGPEKFARTIAAFRNGVTYDEATKAGLGVTVDELDSQWRESLPYKSILTILIYAATGACAVLFLAGALVTMVVALRRMRLSVKRKT